MPARINLNSNRSQAMGMLVRQVSQRPVSRCRVKVGLIAANWLLAGTLLLLMFFSGCQFSHRGSAIETVIKRHSNSGGIDTGRVHSSGRRQSPVPTATFSSNTISAQSADRYHQLPVVSAMDRPALLFAEGMQPVKGRLVEVSDQVRILTLKDAEILAAGNSEAASHIREQRLWLKCKPGITNSLLESLKHQEEYERNQSAARAMEAFFQLAEIDAQLPILDRSISVIENAETAILKVHQSGLPIEHDTTELGRQKIDLERKRDELVYNRKLVSGQLALLLNLDPDDPLSIWTDFRPRDPAIDVDVKKQVEIAFENRGDLLGVETLALASNPKSLDGLRQVSAGKSPVMGITPTGLGPARWWQHRLQAQLECLRQKEFAQRKIQLARLAKSQKKVIRAEVQGTLLGVANRRRKVESIGRTIASLNRSIIAAEKAKDIRPIDFPQYLGWKLEVLKLTSDSIHQLAAIQTDISKLQASQGILGKKHPAPEEFARSIR